MGYLLALALIAVIIWLSIGSKRNSIRGTTQQQLQQRNQEWVTFIAAYDNVAKTPAEKLLVKHMLSDIALQGLGDSAEQLTVVDELSNVAQPPDKHTASIQIDNSSLLLYFGAFLFVASVGLFIAFGGASGALRTSAVLLVMAVMYGGGMWLYQKRQKLQPAALTFVGIGIVIAPLVGLAFYSYVYNRNHGPEIWLVTSILCMVLYTHALVTLKKTLLSYLLLFTFLSLFESSVSITHAPIYYFGWGMALVGIVLQIVSRFGIRWPDLKDASRQSAQILLPLSVLAAINLAPRQGVGQLGISLFFATAFYGLETLYTKEQTRQANAVACQASAIAGVGCITYALWHSWPAVVASLLLVNGLQLLCLLVVKRRGALSQNFASVLLIASGIDAGLAIYHPGTLFVAMAGLAAIASAIWWQQQRPDAYVIGAVAFANLPYIYGQLLMAPRLPVRAQTMLGLLTLLVLLAAYLVQAKRSCSVKDWLTGVRVTYLFSAGIIVVVSSFGGALFCLGITLLLAITLLLLAENDHNSFWAEAAGLFLVFPVARSWDNPHVFLTATLAALVAFIFFSLRYRRELLRWGSTILWLLVPLALSRDHMGIVWTSAEYAWAYMAAMTGLILSRAIALGFILPSGRAPLASLAHNTSMSYVIGYCFAADLAIILSLGSSSGHLHTTVILVLLLLTTVVVSLKIEKHLSILILLPLLAQATLLSLIRPQQQGISLDIFLVASTALALASFIVSSAIARAHPQQLHLKYITKATLVTALVTPIAVFFVGHSVWPMPLGLFTAGVMLSYYVRADVQFNREWAGTVITLSLLWCLGVADVHQLQAYVYLIVATLGIYAYWRATRGENEQSNNYLWAMLLTATVPLAIQAIGGQAGGLYGWWLLLEQVAIILLGMSIHKRFVTFWGLYVAVGAVLYQLRNLGWAALTVLALFLIGLAVYQLQRHGEPPDTKA
jgi:hypothetical protein